MSIGHDEPLSFSDIDHLQQWLEISGVDTSTWGRGDAKTIQHLWQEIVDSETVIQGQPALRIVHAVLVVIRDGDRILIEVDQQLPDHRHRQRFRPPTEKIRSGESYAGAALRCLEEELNIESKSFYLVPGKYKRKSIVRESFSYPGLFSKYVFHVLEANVIGLPKTAFWTNRINDSGMEPITRHFWSWQEPTPELLDYLPA